MTVRFGLICSIVIVVINVFHVKWLMNYLSFIVIHCNSLDYNFFFFSFSLNDLD